MPVFNWTKSSLIPKDNFEVWHALDGLNLANGQQLFNIPDYSGKNRSLGGGTATSSNGILAGQNGASFSGSNAPFSYSGTIFVKHIFVVASFYNSAFASFEGLLSDISSFGLLVGNSGTARFTDFSATYASSYRINDVSLASSNQLAPVDQKIAIIELIIPGGISLNGWQIGQDRGLTGRKWRGIWFEDLAYSSIRSDYDRHQIYQYFAQKFHVWQQQGNGLHVFPFAADNSRSLDIDRTFYPSNPYSGATTNLLRGEPKATLRAEYNVRREFEYMAARAFHAQHYGVRDFIYRDYKFIAPQDTQVEFVSALSESGTNSRFYNYSFSARGVAATTAPANSFGVLVNNPETFVVV